MIKVSSRKSNIDIAYLITFLLVIDFVFVGFVQFSSLLIIIKNVDVHNIKWEKVNK